MARKKAICLQNNQNQLLVLLLERRGSPSTKMKIREMKTI
jgi:hypothetical protein